MNTSFISLRGSVLIRKEKRLSSGQLVLEQFMNECLGENLHSSEVV